MHDEEGRHQDQESTQEVAWGRNSVLALIEEAPKRIKKVLIARDSYHQAIRKARNIAAGTRFRSRKWKGRR